MLLRGPGLKLDLFIVVFALLISTVMSLSSSRIILRTHRISSGPMPTPDPFLFCVYHKDEYPTGPSDKSMEAPRRGNGSDFNPSAPYRMYHGDKVPGFPQHPHRGFEVYCCFNLIWISNILLMMNFC